MATLKNVMEKPAASARIQPLLEKFLKRSQFANREWMYFQFRTAFLKVYVRTTRRMLGGELRRTLDIATVDAYPQGTGAFTAFLTVAERVCATHRFTVFVESILDVRFKLFLERRGYQQKSCGELDCSMYLPPPALGTDISPAD